MAEITADGGGDGGWALTDLQGGHGGGWALTDFPRGVSSVTVEPGWGRTQQVRTDPIARVASARVRNFWG